MDNKTYEISSAEWEVMNIIWMKKYASANNIIEEIQMQKDWSPKTIRTLITRLYKKGFIDRKKDNKIFQYYSLVEESDIKYKTSKNFINKVYKGGFNSLVLNFVEKENLSQDEIEELRNILNKK
ncbi:mecA-type methicillin resistance repressor MecI [Staphylococcus hominis]|uniref:mecA-type methicillin resistance repressor MecI n=1 Tax=Staphylococcus hominis TaxID=1290 RepID=UPI00066C099B|nr:mecA-type methicillin resistance repressor MecI [Staphylococcus hominis]